MSIEQFRTQPATVKYENRRWAISSTPVEAPEGVQYWEQLRSKAPAVLVIPVNDEGKIGVIGQNRVVEDGTCHIVYEFPCGWMETDSQEVDSEEVMEHGNRELQEEIGYKANELQHLTQFRLGNFALVPFYVLLGTSLEQSSLPADVGEHIIVEWLSLDEAEQRLLRDQTPTAQVYIALHEYKRFLASNQA
jgi:8-oxo-dGTP pyrophosphatase MutT (NUDIX family)